VVKVSVRRRTFLIIRDKNRVIDEIPNILKPECAQQAGTLYNLSLRSWVVNVVAPEPRNDGIARHTFPLYRTSKRKAVAEKQGQLARLGQRAGASATDVTEVLMLIRYPFELGTAATRPTGVVLWNFKHTLAIPSDRIPQE
jgi:hypothetical protein